MSFTNIPLLMRCITHLHAGSDDTGIGIIDKMVQRDQATGLPCVHASSLKGAIKQHMHVHEKVTEEKVKVFREVFRELFGSTSKLNTVGTDDDKTQQGHLAFLPARLLFYPAQGEKQPYFLVTCPAVLTEWADELDLLGNKNGLATHLRTVAKEPPGSAIGIVIDDTGRDGATTKTKYCRDAKKEAFEEVMKTLGEGFALLSDEDFIELTDDFNLPVVARNALEDGQSQNLWYEQLIPRRSVFWTALLPMKDGLSGIKDLTKALASNLCQVGANASVGMGQVQFKKLLNHGA
jgi:CRISPR-associated protein Cmr4